MCWSVESIICKLCTEMGLLFHCLNMNTDSSHLIALNYKSSNCEIWVFHTPIVLLFGSFEDLKSAHQANMPEDKNESRHSYLQYLFVGVHALYCDSGTWEVRLKNTVLDLPIKFVVTHFIATVWMSGSLPPTAFSFTSPRLRENPQSLPLHSVCLLDICKCFLWWYISSVIYLTWITRCSACPTVVECQNPSYHNRCMDTFLAESLKVMDDRIIEFFIQFAYHTQIQLLVWCPDEGSPACKWHEHFTFTVAATLGQWTHNIVRWESWWDLTSEIPLGYWNMFLLYLFRSFLWLGSPSLDFCSCHYGMLECA